MKKIIKAAIDIDIEFNDAFFMATRGKNDIRRKKISQSIDKVIAEIEKRLPEFQILDTRTDNFRDSVNANEKQRYSYFGFNKAIDEVKKILKQLCRNQ